MRDPTLQEIEDAAELYPSLWVKKHKMVNESGIPLEYKNHAFLKQIMDDLSPLQVILKPPQIGATVMNVLKALYMASHYKKQIIYTLPTASDMYEMVGSGFNRIIAQNQELRDLVADGDTMDHKQVGDGLIRFRGTFSAKQAMMVPSDLNIHDEVDASDAAIITQYETRLQAKADGSRWYFSHPSIAGKGVDMYWQQSDKKEWFITCNECGHEQTMDWPDSISMERKTYICKNCRTDLSIDEIRNGEWRPTSEGAFSGYHISQLICPWISAQKIIEAYEDQTKTKQYFYNYVLGLPYADSEEVITEEQVLQNVTSDFNSQEGRILIGVDTGLPIWYVIMNQEGIFHWNQCQLPSADYDPYKALEGLLQRFPQAVMVMDGHGDNTGPRQLQAKYPGRVFMAFYRKDRKSQQMIKWGEGDELGSVIIDRNRMITMLVEQLREGNRFKINGTRDEAKILARHFANMIRTKEDTPFGVEYRWEKNNGAPDHLAHAMVFALAAYDRYAGMPEVASNIKMGGSSGLMVGESTWNDLLRYKKYGR